MSLLDQRLWHQLEAHGVAQAHLEMLLRALETHRNGALAWHFVQGRLDHCDLRVTMPARPYEVSRVSEVLLDGGSVGR